MSFQILFLPRAWAECCTHSNTSPHSWKHLMAFIQRSWKANHNAWTLLKKLFIKPKCGTPLVHADGWRQKVLTSMLAAIWLSVLELEVGCLHAVKVAAAISCGLRAAERSKEHLFPCSRSTMKNFLPQRVVMLTWLLVRWWMGKQTRFYLPVEKNICKEIRPELTSLERLSGTFKAIFGGRAVVK